MAVDRTSNVSQSEIKYTILFGTSRPNLIFAPGIATQRPSVWWLEEALSSEQGLQLLSTLLMVHASFAHLEPLVASAGQLAAQS